jgi:hypothetical protein
LAEKIDGHQRMCTYERSLALEKCLADQKIGVGLRLRRGVAADGGRADGEMADAEEEEAIGEGGDVIMTEAEILTTTVIHTEAAALATNH